ncbi:MAG TPA: phosphoribosylaminoimidazolesuccinocarboxamide synthase, partial [Candidatus Limnocylindrales bacterium]
VVRGYVSGSGWKDYQATGAICGTDLPAGLRESDRLPEPIFTPAWKAPAGQHDENIEFERVVELVGDAGLAARVRDASLALYARGAQVCEAAGIILADTKFEFGLLPSGELLLIDEVMTPDSSRFWDAAAYAPGRAQASYDKQFVRDWLEAQPWTKTAPGPELPDDVVAGTRARYIEAYERITGASFARYLSEDVIAR